MSRTKEALPERLYFAYGSNLSTTQMQQRCPQSTAIGLARLTDWTWIINQRGYANIVLERPLTADEKGTKSITSDGHDPSTDPGAEVYGLVYRLHPDDEPTLDRYEGVGYAYEKWTATIPRTEFFEPSPARDASSSATASSRKAKAKRPTRETKKILDSVVVSEFDDRVQMLVYIDTARTDTSDPKEEYIDRMNVGIEEAMEWGLSTAYVDRVIRPYIPSPRGKKRD
ncbi:hypothetical protein F4678DRAFT_419675 [Xylaria arbuscula]|nr:hypothetical protein F4678DRAFT_419675 [Xylaria arbuscula]